MKKIFNLIVLSVLFIYLISVASAQREMETIESTATIDIPSWLSHTFNIQSYSVVGDSRKCDTYSSAEKTFTLQPGEMFEKEASEVCSTGHALFDSFKDNWVPFKEYKDDINVRCSDSATKCTIEVYCCPSECSSNSDCDSGSCQVASCTSWTNSPGGASNGYKCTANGITELKIPYEKSSFNYCSTSCSGNDITCWREESGICTSRTYNCDYSTYPNCPTTYKYTSKSTCESSIGEVNPPTSTTTNVTTCGNGICTTGERMGAPFGEICNQDCENAGLKDNIEIYNVNYLDTNGNKLPEKLTPGQQIKVTFSVRATDYFKGTPYMVEVGVIPFSTAESWGMAKPSGSYSIFDLFSVKEASNDACCIGQSNFADNSEELKATTNFWTGDVIPNTKDFAFTVKVPDSSTTDFCGSEKYWDENSSKEVIYVTVKNGCFKDGYRRNVFVASTTQLDTNATTSQQGETCEFDGQCAEGEKCLDAPGWFTGKTCQGSIGTTAGTLTSLKKIALTREQISSATDTYLMASACYKPEECISPSENYTATCNSLQSLIDDETLTITKTNSFFKSAQATVTGGAIGAGAGFVLCTIAGYTASIPIAVGTAGFASPIILTIPALCTAGGTVVGAIIGNYFSSTDDLVAGIKASDANKVGICTAEEKNSFMDFFKSLALFDLDGNGKKNSTDGMIIFGIIVFLVLIFIIPGRRT